MPTGELSRDGERMDVEVKLFGNLGHYLPDGGSRFSFQLTLDEGSTVEEMLANLKLPQEMSVVAIVNGMQVSRDHVLKNGDDVNVFRPSGGG
jgi:sulfur carrier protein ThiS